MTHYKPGDLIEVVFMAKLLDEPKKGPLTLPKNLLQSVTSHVAIKNPCSGRITWVARWRIRQTLGKTVLVAIAGRVSSHHSLAHEYDGELVIIHPDTGNHLLVPASTITMHIKEHQ